MRSKRRFNTKADHQKFNDEMVASKLTIIAAMATMNSGHGEIALDAMRQKSAACKKLMRV